MDQTPVQFFLGSVRPVLGLWGGPEAIPEHLILEKKQQCYIHNTQPKPLTWGDPYVGPHLCKSVVYISLLEKKIPQTSHFQEMDFNYSFNSETIDFSWNKIGLIPMKSRKFELLIVCVVKNTHNKKIVKLNLFCPISKQSVLPVHKSSINVLQHSWQLCRLLSFFSSVKFHVTVFTLDILHLEFFVATKS